MALTLMALDHILLDVFNIGAEAIALIKVRCNLAIR